MYLKRLEIQGFKSFADRTVIEFLPPKNGNFSITAVVGPNGSGKSNITDAIRWVMGEQSMKTIRSKKSEDVIFSGSEARGAMSVAEVCMVLDNPHDTVGMGAEEIRIVRRLYRSGESEYLINNNPSRLLDIHLLIAKAQFAEHAYSIVSQGMIDRLLTVSAQERKDFFDEASGIKELQIKRHQSFLKMQRTQDHLKQAETIMQEIEPRLKLLARQVKKLEEREEVEKELVGVQESYYFTIFSKNKQEMDQLQDGTKLIENKYRAAFDELESIQNELADLARVSTRQEIFDELQTEFQNLVREKNNYERELVILEGQMHTEYSNVGKQNIGWLESKITETKQIQNSRADELNKLFNDSKRLSVEMTAQKKRLEEISLEKNQLALKINRLQNELLKNESEQQFRDFSGLTAVKAVLDRKKEFGTIYGLVPELGRVEEEYRLALEVAAGQHMTSIVVQDETVARRAIDYLRRERLGTATFLPLNKIQGRLLSREEELLLGENGVVDSSLNLIKFEEKFRPIFSFIFGGTLVVKDLAAAESIGIGRARMVTLLGDIAEKNGVMRGGFRQRRHNIGFASELGLDRADRLEEFRLDIAREGEHVSVLEKKEMENKNSILRLQVEIETLSSKISLLEEQKKQGDLELAKFEQEYSLIKSSPEEYGQILRSLDEQKSAKLTNIKNIEEKVLACEKKIQEFNQEEEKKKQRVFSLQQIMQGKQEEVNKILNDRNEQKISLAKLETKQEDLAQEVYNDMNISLASLVERSPAVFEVEKLGELADQIQKLKYKLSLIGGIDQEVVKEHSETKERFDFLSTQIHDLKAALDDITSLISELDELMKKKRGVAFKKIRKEFNRYFQILFEGGSASLEEVYGEEPNENEDTAPNQTLEAQNTVAEETPESKPKKDKIVTGIEVVANPPGKKVRYLNALSGGERTLTSIALICAILHTNPSPFVVLDEVEAALDEANTQRFVRIMKELSSQSQFIIVTHNRVTMHAADALYGVVMHQNGISKLLSVKMEDAAQYEEAKA